jgi:nicotinate-nucleotide adenylyltransferase
MKIGVFGGTFDPVHNGHLAIAAKVRTQLALQEVWFVPTGQPWLKAGRTISPWKQRVRMVELAIAGKPYFKVSTLEASRPGPSYTIDTMVELRKQFKTAELYFIMGWDSLRSLPLWKEAPRLITLCRLVAIPRPGITPPDLTVLEKSIPGISENVVMLDKPNLNISATEIRAKVAQGQPIGKMVPGSVAAFIKKNKLYQ